MAKMFKHSDDADVKKLAIFNTPPTNTSVKDIRYINHHPISGVSSEVIHFSIPGNNLKYMDLKKTRLYVKCKIRDASGGTPDEEVVFPINHLLHSMWNQVEVFLGGKLISSGSTNFHYKTMLKTLLYKCQNDGMKKQLCTQLFYEDTPGAHDSISNNPMNEGSYYRKRIAGGGHTFEMEGTLEEDALNLQNYLVNGVDLELKLYPARSSFTLMSDNPQKQYTLKIEETILKICTVDVGNVIVSAHDKAMENGGMAQYFFPQAQLKTYSIARGQLNISETIFQGNIPHKIVVALVSADRYNGSYHLNPFNFQHFYANQMSVLINDVSTPHRPLEFNFRTGYFASALNNLMLSCPNIVIDSQSFDKGYSLFVFDINSSSSEDELALQTSGNVRLEVQFAEELPESVQVLVYGEYQSCFQVDHARAVIYKPL